MRRLLAYNRLLSSLLHSWSSHREQGFYFPIFMIFLITFSRWSTYFQARISLCRLLCPFVCSLSLLARGHINLWWSIRAKKMHENEGHAPKDIESWQMYVTCMCMCVNTICMFVFFMCLYMCFPPDFPQGHLLTHKFPRNSTNILFSFRSHSS